MDIEKLIDPKDLLAFSQNFSVQRNYIGDALFPDVKTPNIKAEFYRLSDQRMLPTMAFVHGFDTEAHIGQRPTAEKASFEKMLIKEKINQSERVQYLIDNGADADTLVKYILDDAARLAESVKTRTEVMKCDVLQTGKVKVNENGVVFNIDYGVPSSNKVTYDWSSADADIIGDIQALIDTASDAGQMITRVVTTNKVLSHIRKNKGMQTAILGTIGQGTFLSNTQIDNFMQTNFGFTIVSYDARYQYEGAKKALTAKRYIDENMFIAIATLANGTAGAGLWGVTPEERAQAPWTDKSMSQFITVTQWTELDPPEVWTKASGLFVPILPNPNGLFIATITL